MNQLATVHSLQQRIHEMQPLRLADGGLPVAHELRGLLPGSALRKGSPTAVQGSLLLALALLREASENGAWCGAVGVAGLNFEAAERLGLSLDRLVLAPTAGRHSLSVTGMLSEVLAAVVLRPTGQPSAGEIERLNARLRDHGTVLVVVGEWPRCDTSLRVTGSRWSGLGAGRGMLDAHELTVQSMDRRGHQKHTVRFHDGRLAPSVALLPAPSAQRVTGPLP